MMKVSREGFADQLYDIWGNYFDYPLDLMKSGGTSVVDADHLGNTGMAHLYQFGTCAFMQCDIDLLDLMVDGLHQIVQRKGANHAMTGGDLQVEFDKQRKRLEYESIEWLHYLYPDDFMPYTTTEFDVRQLSQADEQALDALKSACTEDDVEEGWVHVTDELCFGAFEGDKMVACGTMFDWRGFADPGVLVHPDFRQRGLGKAVISPICEWVLDKGRIMDYRCVSTNVGSAKLARRLGFTKYFEIEVFKVVDDA